MFLNDKGKIQGLNVCSFVEFCAKNRRVTNKLLRYKSTWIKHLEAYFTVF